MAQPKRVGKKMWQLQPHKALRKWKDKQMGV
jgi:hypothetical protein